jgi:hypothetical protein
MDIIKKKLQDSKTIINLFDDYYLRLDPLISDKFLAENDILASTIDKLPELANKVHKTQNNIESKINSDTSYEPMTHLIFELYHYMQNLYITINNIYNIFNESHLSAKNLDSDVLSRTYRLETGDKLDDINKIYKLFQKTNLIADISIIEYLSNTLTDLFKKECGFDNDIQTDLILSSFKYIQSIFYQYKNTVSLYAKFTQNIINILYIKSNCKQIMFTIINLIEIDKDLLLSSGSDEVNEHINGKYKNIHLFNPPMKRFGLMPITGLMPFNEIISTILEKPTSGTISLEKYAKSENVGFIIINRIVYNPVEYNIRPLIIKNIGSDISQPTEYGVTKKIIDKFETIKQIKINKPYWDFSYKIIGDHESKDINTFYILETLDGTKYRALAPWLESKKYGVPKYFINQFIKYISNVNVPDRVTNYHNIHIKKSIPNMFLSKSLSLDILDENSKEIDSQFLRNDLFIKIKNLIINVIIDKDYQKGKKILSNVQVNEIIHDRRIYFTFIHVLLDLYGIGTQITHIKEYEAGEFPYYELLSSYLKEMADLSRRFMKELHDGYDRDSVPTNIFTTSLSNKKEIIESKILSLLESVIQTLISNKDNIYITLNYKYLILNFH